MTLSQELLAGSRLALARLITQIENGTEAGRIALDELFPYTGNAHLIGVTGAPGTGKSSLVNQLAIAFRQTNKGNPDRVGIVAVDPSSPFSGGAILGDRVRMRDLAGDPAFLSGQWLPEVRLEGWLWRPQAWFKPSMQPALKLF